MNDWIATTESDNASRLVIDATFGPLTDAATRAFQRAHGVVVDGIVGPETRAATSRPTAPDEHPSTVLERGARGPAVAAWQAALNDWLASADDAETRLVVDGVFGLRTEAVTQHFQSSSDVAVDGIVGPETAAAMRTEATSGTPSTPAAVRV